jgi:nucleoporin NDC1
VHCATRRCEVKMAGLPVRRVPYKDFLQPALQRRFASTATVLLAVSYVEALLLASWDSFIWPWFPIGPAGIRTAFIFICGLAILVLRIAHYHVGRRTIGAGYHTLQANLAKFSTYETAFWYFFSSSLFCPVFLLSMPEFANLSWITYFSGDRARVNERPLFLAFYLSYCALKQSIDHFKDDLDHLDMGSTSQEGSDGSAKPPTSLRKTLMRLPEMFATAVQQALLSLAVAPVLYLFFLRSISWRWALTFLRPFYNLPKTSIPPPSWPMDLFLLVRCAYAGTLLFFIWSAGNIAFSIFMVKEPLKNGQPLTSESKDPNGSLLNGLKSKKLSIQVCVRMEIRGERSLTSGSALQCGSWP